MHLRSYKHTISDLRITASDTRYKPSVEGFYNVNSYYQTGGDGGFGTMYASNGGGGGWVKGAFQWFKAGTNARNIANKIGLSFKVPNNQRNAFIHIYGNLTLYNLGYSKETINKIQYLHERTDGGSKYDSKADIRNNLLVDKIAIQLKENNTLGSLSPLDIASSTLQIMHRIGYFVDAINDVKLMKLSDFEYSNYMLKLLKF